MRSKDSHHRTDQQFDWVQRSKNPCTASLADTWSDITAEKGQSSPEQLALVNRPMTRRAFVAGSGLLLGGGVFAGALNLMSQPALAEIGENGWIAEGAEIETHDGSVESITFGDPDEEADPGSDDNRLEVEWSGFNSPTRTAEFDVLLRGSDDDWDSDEQEFYSIIVDEADDPAEVTLSGHSGYETFSWNDIFGMYRPASVEEHPHIALSDFEAPSDGSSTDRDVEVRIEVEVPGEDLTAYADATATISVTNQAAEITIGGQGTFQID